MAELPPHWDAFLRLQTELSKSSSVDNRSCGLERGLNFILAKSTETTSPTEEDIARALRSERRRERYRADLRRRYLSSKEPTFDPIPIIEMRSDLKVIRSRIPDSDWVLLNLIATGADYHELAGLSASRGALRIRIFRLRRRMLALAA
jgi:hypothetical protein